MKTNKELAQMVLDHFGDWNIVREIESQGIKLSLDEIGVIIAIKRSMRLVVIEENEIK